MKNIIIAVLALLVIGAGVWYFMKGGSSNGPVAVVNGEEITLEQYNELEKQVVTQQSIDLATLDATAKTELKSQLVETLISQRLVSQAAAKAGFAATDVQTDEQMKAIKGQFADDATYNQALVTQGVTEAKLRAQVKSDLTVQAYLASTLNYSSLTASEAEIKAAYDQAAATQEVPALEEVKDQVQQMVLQQKQQVLIQGLVEKLRSEAQVEVLI